MTRFLFSIAAISFAGVLITERAAAQGAEPLDVMLSWSAPAGCPNEGSVRTSIASLLSDSAAHLGAQARSRGAASATSFEAVVTRTGEGFDLTVRVRSTAGAETKTIHGETCEMVADALALIVAFAVDPNLAAPEPPAVLTVAPARAAPTRPASVAPTPIIARPPNGAAQASEPMRWAVGVFAATAAGALPFPSFGVGAVVAAGERPRVEIAGSYWPERAKSIGISRGQATVDVGLIAARPSLCLPLGSRSAFDLCSGIEVGRMAASGSGALKDPSPGSNSWWFSLSAGLVARVPITRSTGIRVRLDVGVPFFRPNFFVDRSLPLDVWQPSSVVGMLSLEPELQLSPTDGDGLGHVR